MRVCFLVHELGASGGMGVIARHARALAEGEGFDVELVVTGPKRAALPDALDGVPVLALAAARGRPYDFALATWWATAGALHEPAARRHALFLQSLEQRFYGEDAVAERFGAASVLGLPLDFVVVAPWMRDLLAALRPDARCRVVANGIDKEVFRPAAPRPREGPLRVLVEGQPTLWFKAVREAVAAVRAMSESATVTVVAPEGAGLDGLGADRVEIGLEPTGMAALYAEHDVLLKLSRVESLGLPPLEAFHVGRPCVLTPFTGHEEYARHGENALVVGFDDLPATARALDRLARDPALLERLARGALATAESWPSAQESSDALAAALRELAEAPAPDPGAALACMQRDQRLWVEVARKRFEHVRGALAWHEQAFRMARAEVDDLYRSREECAQMLEQSRRQLEEVKATRAYRAALMARRLLFWRRWRR